MSNTTTTLPKEAKLATNMSRILDDDFEEFPADSWTVPEKQDINDELVVNDWDDDHVDDTFIEQLRAELNK